MRRIRQIAPLLLLTVFWMAQVQGAVHPISHLRGANGVCGQTLAAPEQICLECAVLAQASAAPLLSLPAAGAQPPPKDVLTTVEVVSLAVSPTAYYRSRAPPLSPI